MNSESSRELTSNIDGKRYLLLPAVELRVTDKLRRQLVLICNQPIIYDSLFRNNLKNKSYTEKMAEVFFYWSKNGWKTNEYFVFFVVTLDNDLVSCLDIKSTCRDRAEIGYWSSEEYRGHMTGAVSVLCDIAKTEKYRQLYARVLPANARSIRLLGRTGFTRQTDAVVTSSYEIYTRQLLIG